MTELLYWAYLGCLLFLFGRLTRYYREFPVFVSFIAFCSGSTFLLHSLAFAGAFHPWYVIPRALAYYPLYFVQTLLIFCVLGELVAKSCNVELYGRITQYASAVPVYLLSMNYSVSLDRAVSLSIAVCMAIMACGKPDTRTERIIMGLAAWKIADAALAGSGYAQLYPVAGIAVVLGCWLPAFPNRSKLVPKKIKTDL